MVGTRLGRVATLAGSPLAIWFRGPAHLERFRRRTLGRVPAVLPARAADWRAIAPDFAGALDLARTGVAFQTVGDRRYDRSGDPRALSRALREGGTIFFPQIHEVLPRLARLMVALRVSLLGAAREECSFLFAVEGQGREGMGLHHDGGVDAFWLQLEGCRRVTVGPPVRPRTPLDLPGAPACRSARGWRTIDLAPGTLLHLPPRTPHRVVCPGRSLAISLTWARPRRDRRRHGAWPGGAMTRRRAAALAAWEVASGRVLAIPRPARARLWVQIPVVAGPVDAGRREFSLWTAEGEAVRLPARLRPWATRLAAMPCLARRDVPAGALEPLLRSGVLAPVDLPLVVRPERPPALDGWRFA